MNNPHEQQFSNTAMLAETLTAEIATALGATHAAGRDASLVVPGGHTPTLLFDRLCSVQLNWARVWVTLTDERWVDASVDDSNEHLVRTHLLRQAAAAAQFVPLKNAAADARAGAPLAWQGLRRVPRPFDYVVLGMGDDGHVASLFPSSPDLSVALEQSLPPGCIAMTAPSAPQSRLSLNLAALLDARRIVLLLVGAAKWSTYQRARARGPITDMPVRALLQQQRVPVSVYWAP